MAAKTGRSKLVTAWTAILEHFKLLVGQTGNDSLLPVRKVAEGESTTLGHPTPFVVLRFQSTKTEIIVDRDKVWSCQLKIRIVTEIRNADDATTECLSKIAQVQNHIESFVLPDGVQGFEEIKWDLTFPNVPGQGGVCVAESLVDFTVAVTRGNN